MVVGGLVSVLCRMVVAVVGTWWAVRMVLSVLCVSRSVFVVVGGLSHPWWVWFRMVSRTGPVVSV